MNFIKKLKPIHYNCFWIWIILNVITVAVSCQNEKEHLIKKNTELKQKLDVEKMSNEINIGIIRAKVDNLENGLERLYGRTDIIKSVNESLENIDKIKDIPESLFEIEIQNRYIKDHGLEQYDNALPGISWPTESKNSFTANFENEYGTKRSYPGYGYQHEGIDIFCFNSESIFSVSDGIIHDVRFGETGWTIEIKFTYQDNLGDQGYYFVRYAHLDSIFVKKGQSVSKDQVIAKMGNSSGIFSQLEVHLHYELWKWSVKKQNYENINPVLNSTWGNKYIDKLKY